MLQSALARLQILSPWTALYSGFDGPIFQYNVPRIVFSEGRCSFEHICEIYCLNHVLLSSLVSGCDGDKDEFYGRLRVCYMKRCLG